MLLEFLHIYSPLIAAFFIFFAFSYLLFTKIFKLKWNIFIHSFISILMTVGMYVLISILVKEPDPNEKVIEYLRDNQEQLINIKVTDITETTVKTMDSEIEVFKININQKDALNANLHQSEDINETSLLIYSDSIKNKFKDSETIYVSKEKLPVENNGFYSKVHYFCNNNIKKLTCTAGLGKVKMSKETDEKFQVYVEF